MKPDIYRDYKIYFSNIGGYWYFLVYDKQELVKADDTGYLFIFHCRKNAEKYIDKLIDLYSV